MTYDAIRLLVISTGLFSVGTMIALYERVGRVVLPQFAMRMIVVSNMAIILVAVAGAAAKIGQPGSVRLTVFGIGTTMQFIGLVMLYRWYGTKAGQDHMARMQAR